MPALRTSRYHEPTSPCFLERRHGRQGGAGGAGGGRGRPRSSFFCTVLRRRVYGFDLVGPRRRRRPPMNEWRHPASCRSLAGASMTADKAALRAVVVPSGPTAEASQLACRLAGKLGCPPRQRRFRFSGPARSSCDGAQARGPQPRR